MEPYRKYLHTYLSLSGPHLGYLYSSNSLFNSGLWLLKMLKSTQVIHQLTLTDDPDLQNTFFYKLCKVDKDPNIFIKFLYQFWNKFFFSGPNVSFWNSLQQKTLDSFKNIILLSSPQVHSINTFISRAGSEQSRMKYFEENYIDISPLCAKKKFLDSQICEKKKISWNF